MTSSVCGYELRCLCSACICILQCVWWTSQFWRWRLSWSMAFVTWWTYVIVQKSRYRPAMCAPQMNDELRNWASGKLILPADTHYSSCCCCCSLVTFSEVYFNCGSARLQSYSFVFGTQSNRYRMETYIKICACVSSVELQSIQIDSHCALASSASRF